MRWLVVAGALLVGACANQPMLDGPQVAAPGQFTRMCATGALCDVLAQPAPVCDVDMKALAATKRALDRRFTYTARPHPAVWRVPAAGTLVGMCIDYALRLLADLLEHGVVPPGCLGLALADVDGTAHIAVVVYDHDGATVADNLLPAPAPLAAVPYRWLMRQVPGTLEWRAVRGG